MYILRSENKTEKASNPIQSKESQEKPKSYLPTTALNVILFEDTISRPSENKSKSIELLVEVKVGCLGIGRVAVSLSNINTTVDMVGR